MNEQNREKYHEYLSYVKATLTASNRDQGRTFPFRYRYQHTCRVLKWAERISEGLEGIDEEVLYTATIFHDIGYATGTRSDHQEDSARLFEEYASSRNMSPDFIRKVSECIVHHSDKELLQHPERISCEQLLVMEADLLDEEGALAICWDGLACGYERKESYREVYDWTCQESAGKLEHNPMVTRKAKEYWDMKQRFLKQYLDELRFDLEEWDNE